MATRTNTHHPRAIVPRSPSPGDAPKAPSFCSVSLGLFCCKTKSGEWTSLCRWQANLFRGIRVLRPAPGSHQTTHGDCAPVDAWAFALQALGSSLSSCVLYLKLEHACGNTVLTSGLVPQRWRDLQNLGAEANAIWENEYDLQVGFF